MTPLSKKRRLETDKGISKPRKRQKVKQAQPKTATVTSVTSSGRPVALEELDWREVPLPDQLDDAEGFFGLEEVDGVDVVHNPQSGQVEYIVWSPEAPILQYDLINRSLVYRHEEEKKGAR